MNCIKDFCVGLVEKALDKNKVYQKQQDWLTETNIELQNLKDENALLKSEYDKMHNGITFLVMQAVEELRNFPDIHKDKKHFTPAQIIQWGSRLIEIEVPK